ncbi:nitroreductase family deazaflavin-dependent oxidoreductase [Streptomyces sp. NPDC014006]|uniref:nitroreductase family deazaflavin-dependent oxidoreductase n=1 Tax=Streptomyces sp. NPDC014006 TaxID=3364870 RepID=UPI0036F7A17D
MAQPGTTHTRPRPLRGWRRRAARLPMLAFRVGLGPLFGQRLLLLHHVGRVSGRHHEVVLEVVGRGPDRDSWIVAFGFGPSADWYRNLSRQPHTLILVGNRRIPVTAHFLPADEGAEIMARYAPRHPRLARHLCAFMGVPVDGTPSSYREAGRHIPFVRLQTASRPAEGDR